MQPLDLTKRPPAPVYDSLDGLMLLPRTIDKARAMLPGGKLGEYKLAGLSEELFSVIGVKEEEFVALVRRAESAEEVAAWLREHADVSKYEQYNQWLQHREINDENRERLEQRYPVLARNKSITKLLDMLDADDREAFAQSH